MYFTKYKNESKINTIKKADRGANDKSRINEPCKRWFNSKGEFAETKKQQNFFVGSINNIYAAVIDKKGQWRAICVLIYNVFVL